jgi:hypothetical protein
MRRYQPDLTSAPGACPVDPVINYQSSYPADFQGCMFCGGTDHVFCGCPQHKTPGASAVFYKNLCDSNTNQDPSICGLMDACGALNTGYLPFHLWLKSERPDVVAEFISFDDANPFGPIKLGGAIGDPADFVSSDHRNLTAVTRCCTPHIDASNSPIALSFALGPYVTVNTILGLPMLCDLEAQSPPSSAQT